MEVMEGETEKPNRNNKQYILKNHKTALFIQHMGKGIFNNRGELSKISIWWEHTIHQYCCLVYLIFWKNLLNMYYLIFQIRIQTQKYFPTLSYLCHWIFYWANKQSIINLQSSATTQGYHFSFFLWFHCHINFLSILFS